MKKLIVILVATFVLVGCGKKEISKECQEMFPALEALNLELDTNPYVSTELAEDRKNYFTINVNNAVKQGSNQNCRIYTNLLKDRRSFLKNAKSEEEVKKLLPPIKTRAI